MKRCPPAIGSSYCHISTETGIFIQPRWPKPFYRSKLEAFAYEEGHLIESKQRDAELAEEKFRDDNARVVFWPDGTLLRVEKLKGWDPYESKRGGTKKRLSGFSWKSRRNLLEKLATICREARPVFVTLTLPREVNATPATAKKWLNALLVRWRRRWPLLSVLWKMEPQKDGTPHFHLFCWGMEFIPWQQVAVDWAEVVSSATLPRPLPVVRGPAGAALFRAWVANNADANPICEKVANAATKVEAIRSARGVRFYAAKYVAKEVEAAAWEKPGRFWGIWGREKLPLSRSVVFATDRAVACRFARIMRRYLRSKTKNRVRCVRRLCTEHHLQWLRVLAWADGLKPPAHDFIRGSGALKTNADAGC